MNLRTTNRRLVKLVAFVIVLLFMGAVCQVVYIGGLMLMREIMAR